MVKAVPNQYQAFATHIGAVVIEKSWDMMYAESDEQFEDIWIELKQEAYQLNNSKITDFYKTEWRKAVYRSERLNLD